MLSRVRLFANPMHYSPPGSPVHGILQARILERVAIPFSRGSSQYRDRTPGLLHCKQILNCLSHQGSPKNLFTTPKIANRKRALICYANSAKRESNSDLQFLVLGSECLNRFKGGEHFRTLKSCHLFKWQAAFSPSFPLQEQQRIKGPTGPCRSWVSGRSQVQFSHPLLLRQIKITINRYSRSPPVKKKKPSSNNVKLLAIFPTCL